MKYWRRGPAVRPQFSVIDTVIAVTTGVPAGCAWLSIDDATRQPVEIAPEGESVSSTTSETQVPMPKILFYNSLLPGMLNGEDEVVVIGGVYEVTIGTL